MPQPQEHLPAAADSRERGGLGESGNGEERGEGSQAFHARAREAQNAGTGTFSGPPIEGFERGWALIPFAGTKPHYWLPDDAARNITSEDCWLPLCRSGAVGVTSERVPALGIGNAKVCKHCARIARLKRLPLPTAADRNTLVETFAPAITER